MNFDSPDMWKNVALSVKRTALESDEDFEVGTEGRRIRTLLGLMEMTEKTTEFLTGVVFGDLDDLEYEDYDADGHPDLFKAISEYILIPFHENCEWRSVEVKDLYEQAQFVERDMLEWNYKENQKDLASLDATLANNEFRAEVLPDIRTFMRMWDALQLEIVD